MATSRELGRRGPETFSLLRVGDRVPGKNVNPHTITQILDKDPSGREIGHLLVDEQGNIHLYWQSWTRVGNDYRKVPVHHGGPDGFDDIQKPINQHQRVISRIMGVETEIEDASDEPAENLLNPPFTLHTYAQALKIGKDRIEIPGERAWINHCLDLVERTIRGASIRIPAAELQSRLIDLSNLRKKFDGSRNPHMQGASKHLLEVIKANMEEKRDQTMIALLGMGQDLTGRVIEISEILAATIRRDAILEKTRNDMEDVVKDIHTKAITAKTRWDKTNDGTERQKIISSLTGPLGIKRLDELTVQPFRKKAQNEYLVAVNKIGEFVNQDPERVGRVLTQGVLELIDWREKIEKRVVGERPHRFPPT